MSWGYEAFVSLAGCIRIDSFSYKSEFADIIFRRLPEKLFVRFHAQVPHFAIQVGAMQP